MGKLRTALLLILPTVTLLVGVGIALLTGRGQWPAGDAWIVLLAALIMAPVVASITLRVIVPGFDLILVAVSAMLSCIGASTLFLLASTSGTGQPFYGTIAMRHGLFVVAGFVAMVIGAALAHRVDQIKMYPFTLLGLALLLTTVTVIFGETVNGARLWLRFGLIQFQPSEIARLLLAGFMASYLYERRHLVAGPWRVRTMDFPHAPYLLPLIGAVLSAVAILMLQNDLGMAALVVMGAFATVAGIVTSKSSIGAASTFLAIAAVSSFTASARVRDRVSGWLDPWRDPAGSGFQFVQADYSLASGGLLGYEGATPALSVPEIHTDFVLVGVASQFGWTGSLAVLVLAGILVSRCALKSLQAPDALRSLLAFSLTALIGIQLILITGGTLRVLPLTGLTFPLLSYGGTSMVATMFALGIVAGLGAPPADRSFPF